MALQRKNRQLTIYPEPTALAIVGGNTPAANRAVACWAIALRNAMPDLDRAEWNFLADVLNGDYALGLYEHGASALALDVHDAQSLNGTGDKWFGAELRRGSGQEATDALLAKVQAMTWIEIQYVRTATNFFWSGVGLARINYQQDEWWTVEFRVRAIKEAEEQ